MNNAESVDAKVTSFRTRFKELLDSSGYTYDEFAKALNDKSGTHYSRNDVSRWLHTGSDYHSASYKDGKENKRSFPKFETLLHLSDFFSVDVGYLLGETDSTSFNTEKCSHYLCLNPSTIEAIRSLTDPDFLQSNMSATHYAEDYQKVLDLILQSPDLADVLDSVYSLITITERKNNLWDSLKAKLGSDTFDEAMRIYQSTYDYENDNDNALPDEICNAIKLIDTTIDKQRELEETIKVTRYSTFESFVFFLNSFVPQIQ